MKDFDSWNSKKKIVDSDVTPRRFYKEREIWWCTLGVNIGTEQNGTGEESQFARPVLIVKSFGKKICLVVPITSSPKVHKYRLAIGHIEDKQASVILSQIRVVDIKRLTDRIKVLDKTNFRKVKEAIKDLL